MTAPESEPLDASEVLVMEFIGSAYRQERMRRDVQNLFDSVFRVGGYLDPQKQKMVLTFARTELALLVSEVKRNDAELVTQARRVMAYVARRKQTEAAEKAAATAAAALPERPRSLFPFAKGFFAKGERGARGAGASSAPPPSAFRPDTTGLSFREEDLNLDNLFGTVFETNVQSDIGTSRIAKKTVAPPKAMPSGQDDGGKKDG